MYITVGNPITFSTSAAGSRPTDVRLLGLQQEWYVLYRTNRSSLELILTNRVVFGFMTVWKCVPYCMRYVHPLTALAYLRCGVCIGGGGWESRGCVIRSTDGSHTTCQCDHLTHFGVLLVSLTGTVFFLTCSSFTSPSYAI